jgi:hypothetical protein
MDWKSGSIGASLERALMEDQAANDTKTNFNWKKGAWRRII